MASSYFQFSRWHTDAGTFEIASRPRLDTRQVVPYFDVGGRRHVGLLSRDRASRAVRGAPTLGWEAIGIDLAGVDETGDVRDYGRAIFTARAPVQIDDASLAIPLPSHARSVGYLAELSLPLAVPVMPPTSTHFRVSWSGGSHEVLFMPIDDAWSALSRQPVGEDLVLLLSALRPRTPRAPLSLPDASAVVARHADRIVGATELLRHASRASESIGERVELSPEQLSFLRFDEREVDGARWGVLTPACGESVAVVPVLRQGAELFVLLYRELRPALAERARRQPIFDLPIHPLHVNAIARYMRADALSPTDLARDVLSPVLGSVVIADARRISVAEPAPGVSSELRHVVVTSLAGIDAASLPDGVILVPLSELATAVGQGSVRDPVVALALDELSQDPFARAKQGDPLARRFFVDTMTQGSVVERRLKGYSSIEREQLAAPTYARLMTLLQHEHGVRVVFPETEKDRGFFKASFRVFMADDRPDQRDKQGLHWSHDAFHFALGNYAPKATRSLREWYVGSDPLPPATPPEGPEWDAYRDALKTAEDEATFFSFFTLLDENPKLASFVGQLTYRDALASLGVTDPAEARRLFDALTRDGHVPDELARVTDPAKAKLFTYMAGFRDYHDGDIRAAFAHASRDPYRETLIAFGLYSDDRGAYVSSVRAFSQRLAGIVPSLNPLLAFIADVRLELNLRVWDVVKAWKLARAATSDPGARVASFDALAPLLDVLHGLAGALRDLRADVVHAELSPNNEDVLSRGAAIRERIAGVRASIWDAVATTGLVDDDVLSRERVRELPR